MTTLEAALEYQSFGWSVLALCPPDHAGMTLHHIRTCGESRGKRPWHDWKECQQTAAGIDTIRQWWQRHPTSNVGMAYGPVSGLVGVDVDGERGEVELAVMSANDLPPTLEFVTSKNGRRLLYAVASGTPLRTTAHKTGETHSELRLQAIGAQTVMPPSLHKNGGIYAWKKGHAPGEIEEAMAPSWLLAALAPPPPPPVRPFVPPPIRHDGAAPLARAAAYLDQMPEAVTGEGGHDRTFAAARAVVWRFDLGPEAGYQLLAERYNPRCRPCWSERELRHKCQQADTVPCNNPRGDKLNETRPARGSGGAAIAAAAKEDVVPRPAKPSRPLPPPSVPFPLHALPRPLRRLAEEGGRVLECDPTYIALPALSACASAVGNTRSLRIKDTWFVPPILWTAIVGDSGTKKSPAFRLAMTPLWEAEEVWRDQHETAMSEYEAEVEKHKDACRKAKENGKPKPEAPIRPGERRACVQDVTIECLAELLSESPRGLLVARDEMAAWLGSFTRYKSQGTDLPNWLELYDASTLKVDRKTGDRKCIIIPYASACIAGGIQPGQLARCLGEEHFDAGLVARILFAWPEKLKKQWSEEEVDPSILSGYSRLVGRLLAYTMRDARPARRRPVPHVVRLDGQARRIWTNWYDSWGEEQEAAEGAIAAMYSKIEAAAARLALVHHCCLLADLDEDDVRELLPQSMEAGVAMARWFASEGQRIYGYVQGEPEDREMQRLAAWVTKQGDGKATARRLNRANASKYPTPDSARVALDSLVTAGHAAWKEGGVGPKGGRPTEFIELTIPVRETDETDETSPSSGIAAGGESF